MFLKEGPFSEPFFCFWQAALTKCQMFVILVNNQHAQVLTFCDKFSEQSK